MSGGQCPSQYSRWNAELESERENERMEVNKKKNGGETEYTDLKRRGQRLGELRIDKLKERHEEGCK